MDINKTLDLFNDKEVSCRFAPEEIQTNKAAGVLPYLIPILFFLPIVKNKESEFCKFHANQQLTWLIVSSLIDMVIRILSVIPIIGAIAGALIGLAEALIAIALAYSAANGMAVRLPYVGNLLKVF